MGRYRNARTRTTKNKSYSKRFCTARRPMDLDQIQDNIAARAQKLDEGVSIEPVPDEDLPGLGLYHCVHCARHFVNQAALDAHLLTRVHIRRVKKTQDKQYTHAEAELGAGRSIEKLPPAAESRAKALSVTSSAMAQS